MSNVDKSYNAKCYSFKRMLTKTENAIKLEDKLGNVTWVPFAMIRFASPNFDEVWIDEGWYPMWTKAKPKGAPRRDAKKFNLTYFKKVVRESNNAILFAITDEIGGWVPKACLREMVVAPTGDVLVKVKDTFDYTYKAIY